MPQDPLEEWRRLTTLYSEMGDVEILELADQINDLTENAQQVLRDEMRKRGIAESRAPGAPHSIANPSASIHIEPRYYRNEFSDRLPAGESPHEYTWKTPLCEFETGTEARQLAEALTRSGVDSWIRAPGAAYLDTTSYQILVGADQLDQARAIAAQPIPQDIIDEMKEMESAPAYELPTCPKCRAADPILESVEPSNNWLCESCGHTWSDPIDDASATTGSGAMN